MKRGDGNGITFDHIKTIYDPFFTIKGVEKEANYSSVCRKPEILFWTRNIVKISEK